MEDVNKINQEFKCIPVFEEKQETTEGKLSGYSISIKDCICVKGMETCASSAILKGYKPLFNATAVEKVLEQGGKIIGKTVQDEFGFGSFSLNVGKGYDIPLNPNDKERVCGGSSGGSACLTKVASFKHISLAESTGGSIVCPAAYCGVVGLCPTYGRVSRYGLLDYGNSLDKIGPMAKTVKECALALEIISGFDEKDSTSLDVPVENYSELMNEDISGLKIGLIKESINDIQDEVKLAFEKTVEKLKEKGAIVEEVSLPLNFKYGISTYYIIALSESSTNLSKYCGMRYGAEAELKESFNEYFSKIRSEKFGDEAKRRIMLGTFARMSGYRDAYYIKATKVRTLLINEYKELFKEYDVLISPTMPNVAPKIKDATKLTPLENYMMDVLTVGPNLAGLPHISVPILEDGKMPVGFMIIGDHLQEGKILQVAKEVEE
ncbi:aspartyl/glutamyl-tRNA amidotransferase subunit A [Candidatus Woesearchaeota archaeon]|nr:aspartyl/glutamyl-tRNA amidotransferase subunit A [Candidatus Woesearchaeota archaeon]